jgi:hypothetical protein
VNLIEFLAAGAAVTGVTGLTAHMGARSALTRLSDMRTALLGEKAREVAGLPLPAVPSLGQRIETIRCEQMRQIEVQRINEQQMNEVLVQFSPNGGISMRDVVDRAAHDAARSVALAEQMTCALSSHAALPSEQAHGGIQ